MTPYLHLANKLAEKGNRITFLLPKKAQKLLEHLSLFPQYIVFHPLTIPHLDGLPPGAQTASDITVSLGKFLTQAMDLTRDQLIHLSPMLNQKLPHRLILHPRSLSVSFKNCDIISSRTCHDIKGQFCDFIELQYQKKVLLTGPISLSRQINIETDQFQELCLGMELTGLPFLVAVKPPKEANRIQEALPEGFEERVKGRGVVWGGWVQQPLLLAHPSNRLASIFG
ncbi:hypothetical protein F2Q70_00008036 [Brassica cretica]|uniref:Uncharacterized protein n=1 Tax=Brassica cretica TaxID=69181 RepID=A0A8S9M5L6_BRACR|nr:hypothetical protein F2Q70_00008036 [Brassica cretica]